MSGTELPPSHEVISYAYAFHTLDLAISPHVSACAPGTGEKMLQYHRAGASDVCLINVYPTWQGYCCK